MHSARLSRALTVYRYYFIMAITKSAKRVIRASEKKRVFNIRRMRTMRNILKEIRKAVSEGKVAEAQAKLPEAYKAIDKAAKRGVIKKNTASRKKSRLSLFLKKAKVEAK
mgnify:CR=1 FL=1